MMSESNNLLYHPNDGGFDRLEEMEGGALTRYPVLRSVSVQMPRPWSTRGAIALLLVCGVVFGIIAFATMKGSQKSTTTADTQSAANEEIGGVSIINGSGSFGAGTTVENDGSSLDSKADDNSKDSFDDKLTDTSSNSSTGSLELLDGSSLDSKADDDLKNSSDDNSTDSSSISNTESLKSQEDVSASSTGDSTSASFFEDALANPLENWTGDSQLGSFSFESSASNAFDSESASAESVDDILVSGSDSTDASVDSWFAESTSGSLDASSDGSASIVDWESSFSMSDETTSDSISQSADSSLEF